MSGDELSAKKSEFMEHLMHFYYNKKCADCQKDSPTWASVSLGFFICRECATQHRALGPIKSKVKSTQIDDWSVEELRRMYVGGNKNAYKLPETDNFQERYMNCTDLTAEIDNLAKKSKDTEPGDSFLDLSVKNRTKAVEPKKSFKTITKAKPRFSDIIEDEDESSSEQEIKEKVSEVKVKKKCQESSSEDTSSDSDSKFHHVSCPTDNLKKSVKPSRSPFCFNPNEIESEDEDSE